MTQVEPQPFTSGDATATVTEILPEPAPTRTIADLVDDAGWLNSRTSLHVQDARQLHTETTQLHTDALEELTRTRAESLLSQPLTELLSQLADVGFAWRDLARVIGVSVPALRKWRHGEPATGENRLRVARLVALCDLLEEKAAITDVPSWLEVPLVEDVPITGIDLLAANRSDLILRRALHLGGDPAEIVDEVDPDWRTLYGRDFEVFEADDGLLGIRPRESDG